MSTKAQQIEALVKGGNFIVRAYRDSAGNVSDMVFQSAGQLGYQSLVSRSIEYLFKGHWKGRLPADLEANAEPVVEELITSLTKTRDTLGGPARGVSDKETFTGVNVGHLVSDPESVFVLRLICLRKLPLVTPPPSGKPKAEKALIKASLTALLPVDNYVHRINLYPGKYLEVTAHA